MRSAVLFTESNFGQSLWDLCFRTADLLSCFHIYSLIIRIHFHASMVRVEMMSTNDAASFSTAQDINSSLVLINQLGCRDCDLKQQISRVVWVLKSPEPPPPYSWIRLKRCAFANVVMSVIQVNWVTFCH